MRTRHTAARLAWIVAFVLAAAPTYARACGFCYSLGGNPLALPHPKAIEVAVATRAAIEKGLITERNLIRGDTLIQGSSGFVALEKVPAPKLVQAWAAKLGRLEWDGPPLAVHFLFIDAEQTCELSVRGGTAFFEAKPSSHSDARVVTTRATFHTLLDGALSQAEARRLGLLLVEGDARAAALVPGQPR
jgi:hypothetical protein